MGAAGRRGAVRLRQRATRAAREARQRQDGQDWHAGQHRSVHLNYGTINLTFQFYNFIMKVTV